eukprot:scaffold58638_cov63-Phaeocystis_antarctica.AAC.1
MCTTFSEFTPPSTRSRQSFLPTRRGARRGVVPLTSAWGSESRAVTRCTEALLQTRAGAPRRASSYTGGSRRALRARRSTGRRQRCGCWSVTLGGRLHRCEDAASAASHHPGARLLHHGRPRWLHAPGASARGSIVPLSEVLRLGAMSNTTAMWPAGASDWPRLAGAWGSQRRDLALTAASGAPAGRSLSQLALDTGSACGQWESDPGWARLTFDWLNASGVAPHAGSRLYNLGEPGGSL